MITFVYKTGFEDKKKGDYYGKAEKLIGLDGYIKALEERQRRETEILRSLNVQYMIINNPNENWNKTYSRIFQELNTANVNSSLRGR